MTDWVSGHHPQKRPHSIRRMVSFSGPHMVHVQFSTSQVLAWLVKEHRSSPTNKQDPHPDAIVWRQLADTLFFYLKMTSSTCSALQ